MVSIAGVNGAGIGGNIAHVVGPGGGTTQKEKGKRQKQKGKPRTESGRDGALRCHRP
jgi:hypothetical protein